MWQCVKCRENLEDTYDTCWNCGTSQDGVEDPAFRTADDHSYEPPAEAVEDAERAAEPEEDPITCLRCRCRLDFVGTKNFHEGTRWGVLGDIGELFVNKQRFDVYCCPKCGRVEFFVDGIGEQFRPH